MALDYDISSAGTSNSADNIFTGVTEPSTVWTMACWYYPYNSPTGSECSLFGFVQSPGGNDLLSTGPGAKGLYYYTNGTVRANHPYEGGGAKCDGWSSSATLTNNAWNSISISRTGTDTWQDFYINGTVDTGSVLYNGSSKTQGTTGYDTACIGGRGTSTNNYPAEGQLARMCFWNVALTAGEHEAFAAGADPRTIRPDALVFYVEGANLGDTICKITGADINNTNRNGGPIDGTSHAPVLFRQNPLSGPAPDTEDNLLADDLQSLSQVSQPAVGQEHAITADDLQSLSQVSTPALVEDTQNELLADDLNSASELTTPAVGQGHNLTADDLDSTSEVTQPAVGQEHAITADDLDSAGEVTQPNITEEQQLTADDLDSTSEVTQPAVGQDHVLAADDLDSAGEVSQPAVGQEHVLTADDLDSSSELSTPVIGQAHPLLADDLQSASNVTQPVLTTDTQNELLADDLQSASELSTPTALQVHILTADDLQSAGELSTPTAAHIHVLTADDLDSAGEVTQPSLGQEHGLAADDLDSAGELTQPLLAENIYVLAPDADQSVGNWETHTGATTNLYQQIDESAPNDSDYIRSEIDPNVSAVKFGLSNPGGSVGSGQHYVRYRYRKGIAGSQQVDLTVRLIQGASTVVASWQHTDIGATEVTATQILTAPQVSSISDYDGLAIEFEANTP